jgi:hypothetical protein
VIIDKKCLTCGISEKIMSEIELNAFALGYLISGFLTASAICAVLYIKQGRGNKKKIKEFCGYCKKQYGHCSCP